MNPFKQWLEQLGRQRRAGRAPGAETGDRSDVWAARLEELKLYGRAAREWTRIHTRRWAHLLHGAAAENRVHS